MPNYNINLREEFKFLDALECIESYLEKTKIQRDYDPEKTDFMIGSLKAIIVKRIADIIKLYGSIMLRDGKISLVIV